jgi:hypothetical protein
MSEQGVKSHELKVDPETVERLKGMTDRVLEEIGFPSGETTPVPVVKFTVTKPTNPAYKLSIYSIADGVSGYNTFGGDEHPEEDNSRRWVVSIDRGEGSIGTAYDNRGTVYEHGGYEPSSYVEAHFRTGTINELIGAFDDNPEGIVVAELLKEDYSAVEFRPVPLHPTSEAVAA